MALAITTTSPLPDAMCLSVVPYSFRLNATGGTPPYTWSVAGGALPAGIVLNPATGDVSGVSTRIESAAFTLLVTDALLATDAKPFTIQCDVGRFAGVQINTIIPLGVPFSFRFSQQWPEDSFVNFFGKPFLEAKFGSVAAIHPITYVADRFSPPNPPGLTWAADGTLSGIPSALGNYTVYAECDTAPAVLSPPPAYYAIGGQLVAFLAVGGALAGSRYRPIFG